MVWPLYEYRNAKGERPFRIWRASLQKKLQAKLDLRLDMLEKNGDGLMPSILTDTHFPQIKKLRMRGRVQLRPLLCRGPGKPTLEYTLLMGATERDGKFSPKGAVETADARRKEVEADLPNRRSAYERPN